jgi:dienelactone hydrolase
MRLIVLPLVLFSLACAAQEPLGGTAALTDSGDFSARMVQGISQWLDRETTRVAGARDQRWRDAAAGSGWGAFGEAQRQKLRRMIGAVDPRRSGVIEEVAEAGAPAPVATAAGYTMHRVRWPVFEGVNGEGVLLRPVENPRRWVIVVPDADELPEVSPLAHSLAAQGCLVLVPALVDRRDTWSGSEALQRFTNQPHREWITRQAFELGRTLIGYEVQKILAAVDALNAPGGKLRVPGPIAIAGDGEGGLLALHAAALDERISAALVAGYFGPREQLFAEPLYRNVFGQLLDFGDAEMAALIAPRPLLVAHTRIREISGAPEEKPGRAGAAPGRITQPPLAAVIAEIRRANQLRSGSAVRLVRGGDDEPLAPAADRVMRAFLGMLQIPVNDDALARKPESISFDLRQHSARQQRAVTELTDFTQRLMREAERARTAAVLTKTKPGPAWEAAQSSLRTQFAENVIGRISAERSPANPRSRLVRDEPTWRGYEVTLDVLPDVFAWGWLLVPRDLQPGERRPVVVCQHGLEGLPGDVVTTDPKERAFNYYQGFATRLVERGFIVYAPHNPYRGKDAFRMLQRRANPLGLSLFSFIVAQHEVTTEWLAGLPFVDPQRIAFYGLSYGGKSAMRLPALIPRYCLSICSGDFNEWVYKVASPDLRMSYLFTGEWEMDEWNLGWVANYAEMAMLIAPRPFMVERGHDDGVALDEWVGYEFAKVKRGYDKLGIGDRTEIEWFDGPHMIHGVGTFDFLHRHLAWPRRK